MNITPRLLITNRKNVTADCFERIRSGGEVHNKLKEIATESINLLQHNLGVDS